MAVTAGIRYDYENAALTYRDSLLFTGDAAFGPFHASDKKSDFHAWLPKFSFMQKWNDRVSLYLSIAKGYKAGGYNIIANEMSSLLTDLGYDEEKLWNYELGFKYFSPAGTFNHECRRFLYRLEGPADIRYGYDGSEYKKCRRRKEYRR